MNVYVILSQLKFYSEALDNELSNEVIKHLEDIIKIYLDMLNIHFKEEFEGGPI